jgi:tetratricopeptide (TPR) repeat protein
MKEFDKLWNYSDPAATEIKFREVLEEYAPEKDLSGHLQLLTQIARTNSLRQKFDEAHSILNEVEAKLPVEKEVAHVRYHLERGRTFNSGGIKDEALKHFKEARQIAEQLQEDSYAVDAIHMQAIAAPYPESIQFAEEGVLYAEGSSQERAKNWLGPLYNNLGWTYFDNGEYEKALSIFLRSLKWHEEKKFVRQTFIAKWTVARALRALNRLDEALTVQLGLMEEMLQSEKPDGYVYEELAELYLLKNDPVNKMYFQFAYNELSKDEWLMSKESARVERLLEMSK